MRANSETIDISIVIPAFNEEKRIINTLNLISGFFDNKKLNYEIIVVDDGSRDNTVGVVKESGIKRLKLIQNAENNGKGYCVRACVLSASGCYILFTDADNSTPISEFDKIYPYFGRFKVIIGSRYIKKSDIRIKQPLYRRFVSRLGNILIRNILNCNLYDTQCGFKAFEKSAAKEIFKRVTVKRFGFDMEALAISRMLGYEVKEVGVSWINDPKSKVHIVKDSIRTFIDLLQVKLNIWLGRYK